MDNQIIAKQEVTFEKVWLMFQKTDNEIQELKGMFKETDRKWQETHQRMLKTDEKLDKLSNLYGNVAENNKDFSEDFFYRGLENKSELCGIKYEEVGRLERKRKKLQGEYDIVLYNGDTIIVIEVKYKLHPKDVQDFYDRKLPNFRLLFPEYSDKKIVGGVAGLNVPTDSVILAQSLGLIVLCSSGENISVANAEDFVPQMF